MINLTDLIYLKKGFLSDEECQIIIDDFENSPAEAAQERCPHAFTKKNPVFRINHCFSE